MTQEQHFAFISELLRRSSSIVLEPGKEYLLESRLLPLARTAADGSVAGLITKLQAQPEGPLRDAVVDAMTTTETSWFRDRLPFEALRNCVLPAFAEREKPRELRIWSAGCATGQEPYSIAMVLMEWLNNAPNWTATVLATDRSTQQLERARAARYSQLEINRGLPVANLVRYFEQDGTHWNLSPAVRRLVEFRVLNLAGSFDLLPPIDVVFLRNVLIYFDVETKREVLRKVAHVLRPGGVLFLGASETTLHLDLDYQRCEMGEAVCYRFVGGVPA